LGEIERIVDHLQRAFDGRAWHGAPVIALLAEVDVEQAAARPLKERHTIWELVLHINAWRDKVRRVLGGEEMESLPDESSAGRRWRACPTRRTGHPSMTSARRRGRGRWKS